MRSVYNHPFLGELTINRSRRARRVSLSVRPGRVMLTLPVRYPLEDALAFAESRRFWIERAKQRVQKRMPSPQIIVPPYQTRLHQLHIHAGNSPRITLKENNVMVQLPPNWAPECEQAQQWIRKGIIEALRAEAKSLLPDRVFRLANQHGFRYAGLSFRNAVSRWGSCSVRNTISLSIHLMRLPDHLIDYVILHELCHTREKNHGPKFHALLDQVTDRRHRELDRELKTFSPRF